MNLSTGFRDPRLVSGVLAAITRLVDRPLVLMEICGGQTHAIIRSGLDQLLPPGLTLVHGPGCPVCVTPLEVLDQAIAIAARPGVTLVSYGDMLRVPGSHRDLFSVRAAGGDVRVVTSPLAAVDLAARHPDRAVVFFAIGFETTAPANAMAVLEAERRELGNFSVLVSHACVPAAMRAILAAPGNQVQAFLAAGHVCAVMGTAEYELVARDFRVPIVVTGFEPLDLASGILAAVQRLREDRPGVENAYARVVAAAGNVLAREQVARVFRPCQRKWRGMGMIPASGLCLRDAYVHRDAARRFDVGGVAVDESPLCLAGEILQGRRKPPDCPAFGRVCTPANPLGATMVSSEGACAAYHRYRPRQPVRRERVS